MSDLERIPSARMVRAARALLEMEQAELAKLVGVDRRTIVRLEAEDIQPANVRRVKILAAIRDALEKDGDVRFIFADKTTGEGVVMKRGK